MGRAAVRSWDGPLADHWDGLEPKMPEQLMKASKEAYNESSNDGKEAYGVYVAVVHAPSPYLTYLLVFGETSAPSAGASS